MHYRFSVDAQLCFTIKADTHERAYAQVRELCAANVDGMDFDDLETGTEVRLYTPDAPDDAAIDLMDYYGDSV